MVGPSESELESFGTRIFRRKPWVSAQLRSLMRTRHCAYRIAHTLGTATDLRFRAARASASNALDSAKNRFIASRLEEAASLRPNGENLGVSVCLAPAHPHPSATLMQQYSLLSNSKPIILPSQNSTTIQ